MGAPASERVVFCANATQALNTAILGCVRPDDSVVATDWDHNSVLRPLYGLQRSQGVRLSFWGADKRGRLDLTDLERLCVPGTRLVVVTHGSNLTGNLLDVAACAQIAHAAGAWLLVDCAQTAGAVPFSMKETGADLVAFTGHKALLGPQGTGGIIVAPGVEVEPVLTGGTGVASELPHQPDAYPEHLEAGTLNGRGIAGLGAAARWLLERGVEAVHRHDLELVCRFVGGLRTLEGVTVYGAIAAANALSDVWAMGGEPKVALNIMAVPEDMPKDVVHQILRGGDTELALLDLLFTPETSGGLLFAVPAHEADAFVTALDAADKVLAACAVGRMVAPRDAQKPIFVR